MLVINILIWLVLFTDYLPFSSTCISMWVSFHFPPLCVCHIVSTPFCHPWDFVWRHDKISVNFPCTLLSVLSYVCTLFFHVCSLCCHMFLYHFYAYNLCYMHSPFSSCMIFFIMQCQLPHILRIFLFHHARATHDQNVLSDLQTS